MKQNQLGQSNLFVSEIGFGCMSLPSDEKEAIYLLHEAIDHGINFFDTADLYEQGLNETLVGKALKGKRETIILATKVGNRFTPGVKGWSWDPSKAYIKEAVKASLNRMQVDYIDLYQLHGGTIDDPIDETIEAFEELKKEGIIREYGLSSIRPNVIREYVRRSTIVSVMMQYSLLDRRPEEEMLDFLHENNISVIARGPVAKGLLASRFKEKIHSFKKGYLDYTYEELLETLDQLQTSLQQGESLSQVAIRYVLSHPAVATVIPGASKKEQLLDNLAAADYTMSKPTYAQLKQITKPNLYNAHL